MDPGPLMGLEWHEVWQGLWYLQEAPGIPCVAMVYRLHAHPPGEPWAAIVVGETAETCKNLKAAQRRARAMHEDN